jgi:hypothetical protein
MNYVVFQGDRQMGELFQRYFQLLAGRTPGAEYGVIATPPDEEIAPEAEAMPQECLCPAC